MPEQSLNSIIDALEGVLKRERAALLAADFGALPALIAEKERWTSFLDAALLDQTRAAQFPAYRKRMAALVKSASENETLLASAKTGVASARARIKDILNLRQTVGVYQEGGSKLMAPGAGVSKQKFA